MSLLKVCTVALLLLLSSCSPESRHSSFLFLNKIGLEKTMYVQESSDISILNGVIIDQTKFSGVSFVCRYGYYDYTQSKGKYFDDSGAYDCRLGNGYCLFYFQNSNGVMSYVLYKQESHMSFDTYDTHIYIGNSGFDLGTSEIESRFISLVSSG